MGILAVPAVNTHYSLECNIASATRARRGRRAGVCGCAFSSKTCWRCSSHCLNERWLSPEGFPNARPSTLTSSSRSGQWMPSPLPIRRHLFRSSDVPCKRRGYHARGTEIVRPSVRSTMSASSVTVIPCATAICVSITKGNCSGIELLCQVASVFLWNSNVFFMQF